MMKSSKVVDVDLLTSKGTVLIDTREFRSALPSLLYAYGFKLLPRTVLVG